MPRSRRQVQQRVVRQVPTGDEMVNSLLNEDIPRIHAEVADDWQPAFDTAGFGSQIAPPAQPAPAAPAPSAPVAAEDAAVAEDPSARLTDWDRANWDIGFPLGSTVPRVNETQVSQASVADALSQVAGGDLDSRMSSSYEGTSGLDEYLSEQAQQGEQRAGQFDSDKGKQEDLGLVGGAKDESKPQTEYEMAQQSAWEAAPAAISSGVIGALGELFGSADYRAQNRGWGQRAAALIDDRVTRDRSFRNREQAAFDRRAGIRGNIEERLGASKEAAQLADPGSEQSQRLQNMYSVRLAMSAPGVEASSLRDYLSNLAYSDEASRQALDGVLESAEKLRSEGRALQQEELIALMNAAVSLRRTDRTAMARENSARSRGGGGGGGNLQSQIDELTRHKINVWMGANNISDPPQSVVDSFRAQATQELSNRSPRARQAWLNQQGAGADQDVRAAGQDDRTVRPEIAVANAEEAMQMFDALPEDRRKAVIRQLALINSSADPGVISGTIRSLASMGIVPNEQDRATASTIQRLLTATVKDNSGAAVSGNEIIRNLSGGGVDILASNPQGFRDALQEYHSMAQGQINRRGTRAPVIDPSTLQVQEGRPRAGGVRVFVKNGVERRSSDPENIRMLQGLGYTEVTQ